jgi:hypothetical protein
MPSWQTSHCYSEDERAVLGRVFVFHRMIYRDDRGDDALKSDRNWKCYAFRLLATLRHPARWGRPDTTVMHRTADLAVQSAFFISNVLSLWLRFSPANHPAGLGKTPFFAPCLPRALKANPRYSMGDEKANMKIGGSGLMTAGNSRAVAWEPKGFLTLTARLSPNGQIP